MLYPQSRITSITPIFQILGESYTQTAFFSKILLTGRSQAVIEKPGGQCRRSIEFPRQLYPLSTAY